ncbi:MAG: Ig-like domain-containing protein [Gemmatimonadales bacterium]
MRGHYLLGIFAVAVVGCKKDATGPTPPPPPPPPTVSSVVVSPQTATLVSLGETTTLSAEVRLSNGAVGTQTPTWSTNSASVATVAGGTVTAVGNGQATITATVGTVSGTAVVTVAQAVASVRILPGDTVIKSAAQLRGAALDARGNVITAAPLQWEALTPGITTASQTGALTPQSTGVARIKVTSGTFTATALARTVWNVNVLADLFPLFEYPAATGQRRALSDVNQAHADARAATVGPAWNYLGTILPQNGSNTTDMFFTTWPEIWTEFNRFCGGVLLVNQTAWQSCAVPFRQHFLISEGAADPNLILRFLSRQFLLASQTASAQLPWFMEGYSQWLAGGSVQPTGVGGKARAVSIADFRAGDTQSLLAPLDTLIRLPAARYYENLPQRTPVAVRMAQGVVLVSYLATETQSSVLCNIFEAIRAEPVAGFTNDELIQLIVTKTGKTIAQIEAGYLAHGRALAAGAVPMTTIVGPACSA